MVEIYAKLRTARAKLVSTFYLSSDITQEGDGDKFHPVAWRRCSDKKYKNKEFSCFHLAS